MATIRIGTRDSQLALWQAQLIKDHLQQINVDSILVPVKSEGDIDTITPLYAMGVQGVFTRSLDTALLNGSVDIAVHSMKDVPVQLPEGLVQAAVLERASHKDIFVVNESNEHIRAKDLNELDKYFNEHKVIIATSSIRRQAQWLSKYPHHEIENLRGNVNTRLKKVKESEWAGAVFAAAGLERINRRPVNSFDLDWMLPAPAQGAIMVVTQKQNHPVLDACARFNHQPTAIATKIERDFLSSLLGGCATPIAAYCEPSEKGMVLTGSVTSVDGSNTVTITMEGTPDQYDVLGQLAATALLVKS